MYILCSHAHALDFCLSHALHCTFSVDFYVILFFFCNSLRWNLYGTNNSWHSPLQVDIERLIALYDRFHSLIHIASYVYLHCKLKCHRILHIFYTIPIILTESFSLLFSLSLTNITFIWTVYTTFLGYPLFYFCGYSMVKFSLLTIWTLRISLHTFG